MRPIRCPDPASRPSDVMTARFSQGGGSVPNALLGRVDSGRGREICATDGICHDHPLHVLRSAALLRLIVGLPAGGFNFYGFVLQKRIWMSKLPPQDFIDISWIDIASKLMQARCLWHALLALVSNDRRFSDWTQRLCIGLHLVALPGHPQSDLDHPVLDATFWPQVFHNISWCLKKNPIIYCHISMHYATLW